MEFDQIYAMPTAEHINLGETAREFFNEKEALTFQQELAQGLATLEAVLDELQNPLLDIRTRNEWMLELLNEASHLNRNKTLFSEFAIKASTAEKIQQFGERIELFRQQLMALQILEGRHFLETQESLDGLGSSFVHSLGQELVAQASMSHRRQYSNFDMPVTVEKIPAGEIKDRPKSGTYLGLLVGGTNTKLTMVSLNGTGTPEVQEFALETKRQCTAAEFVEHLSSQVKAKLAEPPLANKTDIKALSVGVAGPVIEGRKITRLGNLDVGQPGVQFDLLSELQTSLQNVVPVKHIVNDMKAARLAYQSPSFMSEHPCGVLVICGTGTNIEVYVTGAQIKTMLREQKLIKTHNQAEIDQFYQDNATYFINLEGGHFRNKSSDYDYIPCGCGKGEHGGHLETEVAGAGIRQLVQNIAHDHAHNERLSHPLPTELSDILEQCIQPRGKDPVPGALDTRELHQLINANDSERRAILSRAISQIAPETQAKLKAVTAADLEVLAMNNRNTFARAGAKNGAIITALMQSFHMKNPAIIEEGGLFAAAYFVEALTRVLKQTDTNYLELNGSSFGPTFKGAVGGLGTALSGAISSS